MQYLVTYTSNYSPLKSSGGWKTNSAGLKFSHKFGFGAVDAEAMVTRARNWIPVPAQQSCTIYPGVYGLGPLIMCGYITSFFKDTK